MQAFDLAILLVLVGRAARGSSAFAFGGLFITVFYVAPPIKLKHHGLGEPGVFIVWGPLMIGGTYFVATGTLPGWVWLASLPYAILVTTVLFGKHIDKIEPTTAKGIHTLPVILGERARCSRAGLMIAFYPIVNRLGAGGLDRSIVVLVRARHPAAASRSHAVRGAATESPPQWYVGWPLWFVGARSSTLAAPGALLIAGLLLNAILPGLRLPWT